MGAGGDEVAPAVRFDQERLDATLDDLTAGLRRPVVEGTVRFRDGEARPVLGRAGTVVDRDATEALLQERFLRGGTVPLPTDEVEPEVTEELLSLDNVVLVPHVGSATRETREAMGLLCVEALREVLLEHRLPANALDPLAWAKR